MWVMKNGLLFERTVSHAELTAPKKYVLITVTVLKQANVSLVIESKLLTVV